MNILEEFPITCRVKIFLRIEILYEGIVAFHWTNEPERPPIMVIEDGNNIQRTFAFFKKINGKEGWTLIPNDPPLGFSLGEENPFYIIKRVEIPEGIRRFSFIECTCPKIENEKHGHIFDEVEGKNSPAISCSGDAESYFSYLKLHGCILGNDFNDINCVMEEIKKYFA